MKCLVCGKTPADGVNLYRQNPKGQLGIWACYRHSKPVEDELVSMVGILQKGNIPKDANIIPPKSRGKNE